MARDAWTFLIEDINSCCFVIGLSLAEQSPYGDVYHLCFNFTAGPPVEFNLEDGLIPRHRNTKAA